jgi:hypothetical protein
MTAASTVAASAISTVSGTPKLRPA